MTLASKMDEYVALKDTGWSSAIIGSDGPMFKPIVTSIFSARLRLWGVRESV
jgi:hypothetical protein